MNSHTTQMRWNKITRRLAVVSTSLVLGVGALLGSGVGTADAAVSLGNGASASTSIACSASMQWVNTTVAMNPQQGFRSQYVAWRQYVYSYTTGESFWTNWTNAVAPFKRTYTTNVGGQNLKL